MLAANLLKWTLVLLLFVALPVALLRVLVRRTIEIPSKHKHKH